MSDAPRSPMLAYSSSGGRTPWRARVVIGLLLASNLYFVHDKWRPDLRLRMLWHQRRCLAFEWPEGQVLFEGDPARAAALVNRPGYVAIPSPGLKPGESLAVSHAATERIEAVNQLQQRILPLAADIYAGGPTIGPGPQDVVAFLHELTSTAGNRRLVIVWATRALPEQTVFFEPFVLMPGTFSDPLVKIPATAVTPGGWAGGHTTPDLSPSLYEDRPSLRIFAGRHDPQDRSRFTVEFENFYGRNVIEGRLDDADFITMKIIEGIEATDPAYGGSE